MTEPRPYYMRYDDNWDCQVFLTDHPLEDFRRPEQRDDIISSPQSKGLLADIRRSNPGEGERELELPCNGFPIPDYYIKCSKDSQVLYEKLSAGGEPTAIGPAKRLIQIIPDGM
jgi:hypothetical protein